jgi:UDP-glucose 4-epimerase
VLGTSRFSLKRTTNQVTRESYASDNIKVNEFLFRRVDLEDVVAAHMPAASEAQTIGFRRYIGSATTPFLQGDTTGLRLDAPAVVRRRVPNCEAAYEGRGWRARHDFASVIDRLSAGNGPQCALARLIGCL